MSKTRFWLAGLICIPLLLIGSAAYYIFWAIPQRWYALLWREG